MQKWVNLININICQTILGKLKLYPSSSLLPSSLLNSSFSRLCSSSRIRVRKVLPKDASTVVKIVQDNFGKCEPLVQGLEMSQSYSPALVEFWRKSIDQGMSYVAVPNQLSKIESSLGVIINTNLFPWEPDHWWKFATCIKCPKTRDLIGLYSFLIKDSKIHNRFHISKIFNIAHIICNEEISKNYNTKFDFINLSTVLVDKALTIAEYEGYKLACLICTGQSLTQVAENLKMDQIYEFPYKKLFNDKLEPIVKSIEPNLNAKIFIKRFETII